MSSKRLRNDFGEQLGLEPLGHSDAVELLGMIEQLRDIYLGKNTYSSEQEWLDNLFAQIDYMSEEIG